MASPDWVVLGSPSTDPRGRFVIYASTHLGAGELRKRVDETYYDDFRLASRWVTHELLVTMNDYVLVFGDSYGDCWQKLVQFWSPETGSTTLEIEGGNRAELGED